LGDWRFFRGNWRKRVRLTLVLQTGHPFHGNQETVANLGHGPDELGIFDGISQRLSQLFHGRVDPMLEVNEGIVRPQCDTQLLASNDSPFAFQQQPENLERLLLNPNRSTLWCPQVTAAQIDLELVKASTN
jgi:hypothetical protein